MGESGGEWDNVPVQYVFRGATKVTLDAKGRMVIPTRYRELLAGRGDAPLAVCHYCDGRGHPLAFSRELFGELGALHGDKGVWGLLERHAHDVVEVPVHGAVPRDVDTWSDYEAVFAS